jgi:hypothetical protein
MPIWLSVIMPTFNGARYVAEALESVAVQADRGVEVIVVDDGSDDDTVAIVRGHARDFDLQVIQCAHNGNWVSRVNLGIRIARGSHLGILHQDDAWRPGRLNTLKRLIASWPAAPLVAHPCWYIDPAGRRVGYWRAPLPRVARPLSAAEMIERLLVQCFIASPAPIFRADAAERVGLLDEDLWYSADWDFWLRLAALGGTVWHPTPLASFRLHGASQTLRMAGRGDELRRQQDAVLTRHLPAWRRLSSSGARIENVARFSANVNVALADRAGGRSINIRDVAKEFLRLGPVGWACFWGDSQIIERCLARIRAGQLKSIMVGPPTSPATCEPSAYNTTTGTDTPHDEASMGMVEVPG